MAKSIDSGFKTGDKVRLLHETGEAMVIKPLPTGLVEVETADGFRLQVQPRELVKISRDEAIVFKRADNQIALSETENLLPEKGIFASFCLNVGGAYDIYVVNNTSYNIYLLLLRARNDKAVVLEHKEITSKTTSKLSKAEASALDGATQFEFQWLTLDVGKTGTLPPRTSVLNPHIKQLSGALIDIPQTQSKGRLFRIDQIIEPLPKLTQIGEFALNAPTEQASKPKVVAPPAIIDLHAEALFKKDKLPPDHMLLTEQLRIFDDVFDRAFASGLPQLTVIHGLGNGRLKSAIIKRITNNPNVQYYQQASPDKFGAGATLIKFK